ncbi:hypothetical protein ACS0TY_007632 [Phlomoides rotata]
MLEKLHLHPRVLKVVYQIGFADSLNSLKVLNLSMYLYSMKEVAFSFCLARSSPNLQMLRVTKRKICKFFGFEPEVDLLRSGQVISRGIFNFLVFVYKRPTGEVEGKLTYQTQGRVGVLEELYENYQHLCMEQKIPPTLEPGAVKEKLPEAHYDDHDHQKCIKDEEDAENAKKYEWSKVELHLDLKRENHPWTSSVFSLELPDDAKLGYAQRGEVHNRNVNGAEMGARIGDQLDWSTRQS